MRLLAKRGGRSRRTLALAILFLPLSACGDERTSPAAPVRVSSTVFADENGLDEQIDPTDTHMVVDVIVTGTDSIYSDEPTINPATGLVGTTQGVAQEADSTRVHTGFTTSGLSVTTTYYAQEPDTSDRATDDVVRTRIVNGVATDYTAANVPVVDTPEESAEGPDPITALPVVNAMIVIDAFSKTYDPGTGPDCNADPSACGSGGGNSDQGLRAFTAASGQRSTARRSVHQLDANTVEVRDDDDFAPKPHGRSVWGGEPDQGTMALRHRYGRQGDGRWRLLQTDADGIFNDGQGRRVMHRTARYHVRTLFRDPRRDAIRRKAMREAPDTTTRFVELAGSRSADVPVSVTSATASLIARPNGQNDEPGWVTPARSVVFVHGGLVSSSVWNRMRPWFDAFPDQSSFGPRIRLTTSWDATFHDQRDQLVSELLTWNVKDPLLIGHSNGGIISRLVADSLRHLGRPVLGVIAINSPHGGVPLLGKTVLFAATARAALGAMKNKCDQALFRGCGIVISVLGTDGMINKYETMANTPMAVDITPGSAFLGEMNARSTQESFNTINIVSRPTKKYTLERAYGDSKCYPDSDCGGRRMYSRTKRLVRHLKKAAVIGSITTGVFAITSAFTGGATSAVFAALTTTVGKATIGVGSVLGLIELVDRAHAWAVTSSVSGRHDGLVPESSQRYSRAVIEHLIQRADSHGASPASPLVRDELAKAVHEALTTPKP